MKTYIFETRKASAPFLRAFTNKIESQTFHVKENNNLNIKSADKVIFDYSWPSWNGEIPENTSAVFQGLLRNTKKVHDVWKFSKDSRSNNPNWLLIDTQA